MVAAELENRPLLPLSAHIATISQLSEEYEFVLVEGAGGVTVDLASAKTGDTGGRIRRISLNTMD